MNAVDVSLEEAVNASGVFMLDAIERERWTLDSWHVAYRPSGISAAGASLAGIGLGVNKIEGETLAFYLFRRTE